MIFRRKKIEFSFIDTHQQVAVDEDNNNPVASTAANNDVKRSVPTKDADSNTAAAAADTDATVQPPTPEKAGARYVLHHKSRGGGGVGAIGPWSKVANPVLERKTLEGNSVKKSCVAGRVHQDTK